MDTYNLETRAAAPRYALLDTLRGATLVSMMAYHACWDLVWMFGADWAWYEGAGAYLWQQSICWTFILLSGFCWPLGRRPWRRGWLTFGCGALITLVTEVVMPSGHIWFGVLTLLGSCMLLMIPLDRLFRRVPAGAGLAGSLLLFLLLRDVNSGWVGFEGLRLLALPQWLYQDLLTAYLGFPPAGFFSTDYFSLLPWCFLYAAGYFLHGLLSGRLDSRGAAGLRCPVLTVLGRRSLVVYMLHQPVIYGALLLAYRLAR